MDESSVRRMEPSSLDADVARRVLDQLAAAAFLVDASGRPCYANEAALGLLGRGLADEDASMASFYDIHRAGLGPCSEEDLPVMRVLAGEPTAESDDLEIVRPDGTVVPIDVMASPIHDAEGSLTHVAAVFWEVTERRAAEHAKALLAAIIDSSDEAVVSVDTEGLVTSWNAAAAATYGYTEEEARGRSVHVLLAGDPAMWHRALIGEALPLTEWNRTRRDGAVIVVSETISPVRTARGKIVGAASVSRDVTARRRADELLGSTRRELERKNVRLERSNAELAEFAYVASHDLSEPLRAISGMVDLLSRRYKGRLDDDADEFIGFAVDGCRRMKAMIDDILVYAKSGKVDGKSAAVDAGEVADEVLASLSAVMESSGATVTIGPLPVVKVERLEMTQLLQNLLTNAIKFHRPEVSPIVELTAERDGDAWRFCVEDNGIGIEPQYVSRIFRMFQRLHGRDEYPGTGIGLAIAQRIVSGLGGRLWVEERRSGGSRFCFTVPDDTGSD